MFKKIVSLLLCVVITATMCVALCSCKDDKGSEYPVTIGEVTIKEEPLNIVVLSDCMADVISYMGYDIKMVGKSVECDQQFISVVPMVGTAVEPNVESIISYETDLVIAEDTLSETAKASLAEAKIPVITLSKASSFENLKSLYSTLGTALGGNVTGKKQGEDAYNELMQTITDYESAVPSNVVKTACYLYLDEQGALCTLTQGTIEYEFFSHCGAINVLMSQQTPQVDIENLKISTPSYIFYDDQAVLDYLNNDPDLANMGALSKNNTYQIKKSDFYRQGVTYEDLIYHVVDFMFGEHKDTPDEATPEQATTTETETDSAAQ